MSSPNSNEVTEFNDLPPEMKYHIFEYLSPSDLSIIIGVCRNWHFLISIWESFLEKVTVTISNDATFALFLKSYTNWTRVKLTHNTHDLNQAQGPMTSDDTFLAKIIMEPKMIWSTLNKLSLFYLKGLESETLIGAIACCTNLKTLCIDHVHFKYELDAETEPISDNITNARRIAQNLSVLKIYGIRIWDMTFLYNSFALNTENLKEFCVKECQYTTNTFVHHPNEEPEEDQTDLFLDHTRTILSNNSITLKTLEFSLNKSVAMSKFYRRVFSTLATSSNNRLQLTKLSLFLYSPGISLMNDSYFWRDWNEEEDFDENEEEALISPTELFNIWREFIGTQMNLQSLRIPHIQLFMNPFEETHHQAFFNLLTSLPPTLKELDATLEQQGVNRQNLMKVYEHLVVQTTVFDMWEYSEFIATADPTFLALETTEGRLTPKSPNLETLKVYFHTGRNITEEVMLRVFYVIVKGCPIHLKKLILRGVHIGDNGLQMIIKYLPLLEVLDMKSRVDISDYGVTGISKSFLTYMMKDFKEFRNAPILEESDGVFVGAFLSTLERLKILKLPSLRKLSDIGIFYGLKLPRLTKLCLSTDQPYNKITDWGLEQLAANCPELETIRLAVGCLTTIEGIQSFASKLKRVKASKSVLKRVVRYDYAPKVRISAAE